MVEPTGVSAIMAVSMPRTAQTSDIITEQIVTALKFLNTRIEDKAGNTTNAEINSAPTRFIANTMTTAIMTASIRLYSFALIPVAVAKSSSKVTVKIL